MKLWGTPFNRINSIFLSIPYRRKFNTFILLMSKLQVRKGCYGLYLHVPLGLLGSGVRPLKLIGLWTYGWLAIRSWGLMGRGDSHRQKYCWLPPTVSCRSAFNNNSKTNICAGITWNTLWAVNHSRRESSCLLGQEALRQKMLLEVKILPTAPCCLLCSSGTMVSCSTTLSSVEMPNSKLPSSCLVTLPGGEGVWGCPLPRRLQSPSTFSPLGTRGVPYFREHLPLWVLHAAGGAHHGFSSSIPWPGDQAHFSPVAWTAHVKAESRSLTADLASTELCSPLSSEGLKGSLLYCCHTHWTKSRTEILHRAGERKVAGVAGPPVSSKGWLDVLTSWVWQCGISYPAHPPSGQDLSQHGGDSDHKAQGNQTPERPQGVGARGYILKFLSTSPCTKS